MRLLPPLLLTLVACAGATREPGELACAATHDSDAPGLAGAPHDSGAPGLAGATHDSDASGLAHASRDSSAPTGAPRDSGALRLADYEPRSMLVTKATAVERAAFPVVDVHNHLARRDRPAEPLRVLAAMDAAGVRTVVNLDGGSGDSLARQLASLDRAHPGRFLTFAQVDLRGIDAPGWSARAAVQLRKDFEAGARGLKIHKNLGLSARDASGKLIAVDDPRLDPVWRLCGDLGRPVLIHTGEPAAFFTPKDRHNERWLELDDDPSLVLAADVPSRGELHAERDRVIARHPRTTFIGAHLAESPEDLATVAAWLDRRPNLVVDIAARIQELGRQPFTARRFFLAYADRVLFGIDTAPSTIAYRTYFRFLETDDEYFEAGAGFDAQGGWRIYGLALPREVLLKIYCANAARALGLGDVCTTAPARSGSGPRSTLAGARPPR